MTADLDLEGPMPAPSPVISDYRDDRAMGDRVNDDKKALQRAICSAQADLDAARERLNNAVDEARASGMSWTQVGEALGVTKQSAWERFSGDVR